jgi:phenylalanyl-tRNA synthetase beta chain
MPVVIFTFDRIAKFFPQQTLQEILKVLPFLGLDIEGLNDMAVRLEYNPNRPDFASDYGIVRAAKGLLEIETGIPDFKMSTSVGTSINVSTSTQQIRPHIISMIARHGHLDSGAIKQLITMQEDLHNIIGRQRIKASIGIHNFDVIKFPVTYSTVGKEFSFIPLGESVSFTLSQILSTLDPGKMYGHILQDSKVYPIILDAQNNVLSFPPIINSNLTRINVGTTNLFVEVTGTNLKAAEDIISILSMTLYDIGFDIQSVLTSLDGTCKETPEMVSSKIKVETNHINKLLGLNLNKYDILRCLRRSRLDGEILPDNMIECTVPRYRTDIIDDTDIVEETAIGFGVNNLKPSKFSSDLSGNRNHLSHSLDIVRDTMIGLGFIEVMNFILVSRRIHYQFMGIPEHDHILRVEKTKSTEHEILRESLIPSLIETLSHNVHEEYPQTLFEVGKVFELKDTTKESWNLGLVLAHSKANYTSCKSIVQTFLKTCCGKEITTKKNRNAIFIPGRSSDVIMDGLFIGNIGEIEQSIRSSFKIRVPLVAAELNLSQAMSLH